MYTHYKISVNIYKSECLICIAPIAITFSMPILSLIIKNNNFKLHKIYYNNIMKVRLGNIVRYS